MSELAGALASLGLPISPVKSLGGQAIPFVETMGGDNAVAVWRKLRDQAANTRHWPVILGSSDAENLDRIAETLSFAESSPAEIIAAADSVDVPAWLRERFAGTSEEYGDDVIDSLVGDWPDRVEPSNRFQLPFDVLTSKPHQNAAIALVPTTHSWEVPAYLNLGGWNECPDSEHLVAVFHAWHERYGAEIAIASADVIECSVTRPPLDREGALELARDQFAVCNDIVTQGTETFESLAAALLNAPCWFFWWD